MDESDRPEPGRTRRGHKWLAFFSALIPVIAAGLILGQLLDTRQLLSKARLWALRELGAPEAPAPVVAPMPGEGAFPTTPTGKQMENAYSELVNNLGPQLKSDQIRIERTRERLQIRFLEQVLFDSGSAKITAQGQDILAKTETDDSALAAACPSRITDHDPG